MSAIFTRIAAARRTPLVLECLEDRLVPTTWTVVNGAAAGVGSLAWAVGQANADTTPALINFDSGFFASATTITLSANLVLSNTSQPITIDGSGAGPITVSGGGAFRVFSVNLNVTATLRNLTVTGGGSSINGAGIGTGGNLTIDGCTVTGNTASQLGGGIYVSAGSLTVTNSTISNNSLNGSGPIGAGISMQTGTTLVMTGSTVSNNTATATAGNARGGGIGGNGTWTITGCTITGNSATAPNPSYGGGVAVGGTMTMTNTTVSNNTVGREGGGILVYGNTASATIDTCTVTGNTASNGGGIDADSGATITVTGTTISGNTGTLGGGLYSGFSFGRATITATNCTIQNNSAVTSGGGAYAYGTMTVIGSMIQNNTAPNGAGLFVNTPTSVLTVDNCTVQNNTASNRGGGIASNGSLTVQNNTTISGNTAIQGGGIYSTDTLTLSNGFVTNNTASNNGGGLFLLAGTANITNTTIDVNSGGMGGGIDNDATLTLSSATVQNNTASTLDGGGIRNTGTLTVQNTTRIQNNTASTGSGGGIWNGSSGTTTINNSTVSGNTARDGGGVMNASTLTVTGATISGNSATAATPSGGGGIETSGTTTVDSSAITGNNAANGGGILQTNGTLTVRNNSTIGNNQAGGDGYGVHILGNGSSSFTNTTFSGNFATNALSGFGSALCNRGTGTVDIQNCTMTANVAATGVGGGVTVWTGSGTVTITGSTINANTGIGMFSGGGTLTIGSTTISNNTANAGSLEGGGIYVSAGTVTLQNNSRIQSNTAGGNGGGMVVAGGTVTIDGSDVSQNSGSNGGGIYVAAGTLTVRNSSTIQNNNATTGSGGGISNQGTLTVSNSTISSNTAALDGAALANGATATLTGCTLSNNTAGGQGGAIVSNFTTTTTITTCTFTNNSGGDGGAIHNNATLNVTGSTFTSNVATGVTQTGSGGAIINYGTATVSNSTFTSNTATSSTPAQGGGAIYNNSTLTVTASTFTGNSCLGANNTGGAINNRASATITSSTFAGNSTPLGGGAFYNHTAAVLLIVASSVSGNSAPGNAGAIGTAITANQITVLNSTITGNTGSAAITLQTGTTATFVNCTISGNTGRGVSVFGTATATIVACTITGNTSTTTGGGLRNTGTTSLINTIVAGNTAPTGPDVDNTGTLTATTSLIGDTAASGILPGNANILNPASAGLGTLGNNGGTPAPVTPPLTIPLLLTSPALGMAGAVTQLNGAVANATATTITISNMTNFAVAALPLLGSGSYFTLQIDSEQLAVTALTPRGGNTADLTVVRGSAGTTAAPHASGAAVYLVSDQRGSLPVSFDTPPILNMGAMQIAALAPGAVFTESGGATDVIEAGASDTFTVTLNRTPTANVVVTLTAAAPLSLSSTLLTFTPAAWNVAQTVSVSAADDFIIENPSGLRQYQRTISATLTSSDARFNTTASLTANITDIDVAGVTFTPSGGATTVSETGTTSDTYTVVLNTQPSANVVIALSPDTHLTTAQLNVTFTPAAWNIAQTVTVSAVDDGIAQNAVSPFLYTGLITRLASSGDANYGGLALAPLTVDVIDNDIPGIVAAATGGSTNVSEGGASDSFTVILVTQPSANVVVTVNPGTQLTVATPLLTFTPVNWNVRQVVAVSAVDDAVYQGTRTAPLNFAATSSDAAYTGIVIPSLPVIIADNEPPPSVLITRTPASIALLEGSSQSYTAVLSTPPAADVVINLSSNGEVATSATTLTFTPASWFIPQPVVLTAVDDGDVEGPHLGLVTHTVSSADAAYASLTVDPINADIVDNDGPTIPGTDKADKIVIMFTTQNILVSVNYKVTTFPTASGQMILLAGGGDDHIEVINPGVPVIVVGGAGHDRLFVNGQLGGLNNFTLDAASVSVSGVGVGLWEVENLVVTGGKNNDRFTVAAVPTVATELKGDVGSDTVVGPQRPNTWQITTASGGTLDSSIKLNGVENWTGGTDADTFTFSPGKSVAGTMDGGGGNDVLDYSLFTSAVAVNLQLQTATATRGIRNIAAIIGGKSAADKLIGPDQTSAWQITAMNAGSVNSTAFQNIENLTGGILADTFAFADGQGIKGKIDGGGGNDVLDYSSYIVKPVSINLQTKTATATAGMTNFEQFLGGTGSTDTLTGANKVNAWSLTGIGVGTVAGLGFAGFESFTGGSLADTFLLGAAGDWLGTISGGSGTDILTAFSGRINAWVNINATSGTLNGRKFLAIESRR